MKDIEHIIRLGRALYGERWQRPAAEVMGCNEKLVRMWIAGQCAPADHHVRTLRSAAHKRIETIIDALGSDD